MAFWSSQIPIVFSVNVKRQKPLIYMACQNVDNKELFMPFYI